MKDGQSTKRPFQKVKGKTQDDGDSSDSLDEMYESITKKKQKVNGLKDDGDSSDEEADSEDEWVIKTDTNDFMMSNEATGGPKLPEAQQNTLKSVDTLNKLKSAILKAKIKGESKEVIDKLEEEYSTATSNSYGVTEASSTRVLDSDELRMYHELTEHKRNKQAGKDSTVSDLVREVIAEKNAPILSAFNRTNELKNIGKDSGFENDTDYQFDNAEKLVSTEDQEGMDDKRKTTRKQHQETLKKEAADKKLSTRILEHTKLLDDITTRKCYLCPDSERHIKYLNPAVKNTEHSRESQRKHHSSHINKIISASPRIYLARPPYPALSRGTCVLVPREHRCNLLHCDEDEWEELRNYMKCLIRMWVKGRGYAGVVFYENAVSAGLSGDETTSTAQSQRDMAHALMYAVPIKDEYDFKDVRAMFKEAMLTSDEEWSQHRKVIDTQKIASQLADEQDSSAAKFAVRRSIAKEAPYFHAWFDINGGLGHIVEDRRKWPRGDLFAREILGNLLRTDITKIRRTPRWENGDGNEKEIWEYQHFWDKFDWTNTD